MIHMWKFSLALSIAFAVAAAEEPSAVLCDSICGNTKKGLSTPDFAVEYNWNSRVPVCAGKSCDTGTCSELELKLRSYDEIDCPKHQTGLQEAGCECKGKKSSAWISSRRMAATAASATIVVTMLL